MATAAQSSGQLGNANQTQLPQSNSQMTNKSKEPDDPVSKVKSSIPLLREVVMVGITIIIINQTKQGFAYVIHDV